MIPKSLRPLLNELFSATESKRINWAQGAHDAYFSSRKAYNFHIRYFFSEDAGEAMYVFNLQKGDEDARFIVVEGEDDYHFMQNLYSSATANAMKLDDIDTLFD